MTTVEKLSPARERAVINSVERIIEESRSCPGASLNKVACGVFKASDLSPELIKRACEAYNRSKSVYMLTNIGADRRAEAFDLLSSEDILQAMHGAPLRKAAEFSVPSTDFTAIGAAPMRKAAAHTAADPEEHTGDIGALQSREAYRAVDELTDTLVRLGDRLEQRKIAADSRMSDMAQCFRTMPKTAGDKAARLLVNRYGDDGVRLMKVLSATIGRGLPMEKTASHAILPAAEPYVSAALLLDDAAEVRRLHSILSKVAADGEPKAGKGKDKGKDKGNMLIDIPFDAAEVVAHSTDKMLDPLLEFSKAPIYQKMVGETKKNVMGEIFDPETVNRLKQLKNTQLFVDVAADDFTKGYPIEHVTEAYNNIVGAMPELQDKKYLPWLKMLVKQQLVQGRVMDQATVDQMMNIKKSIVTGRKETSATALKAEEAVKAAGGEQTTAGVLPEAAAERIIHGGK